MIIFTCIASKIILLVICTYLFFFLWIIATSRCIAIREFPNNCLEAIAAIYTMSSTEFDVDAIIDKLLEGRGARPGKEINLPEDQIKILIQKATDVFMSQDVLLQLQAPIKVCGRV